jgi:hypothetical protein
VATSALNGVVIVLVGWVIRSVLRGRQERASPGVERSETSIARGCPPFSTP